MFQIAACLAYAKRYGYRWGVPSNARESSILRHWPNLRRCDERFIDFPRNGYDSQWFNYFDIGNQGDNITLAGYFQSEKFFHGAEQDIYNLFVQARDERYADYVSIHVRRGDYVQHAASFPPIEMDYIRAAMDRFPGRKFVCMSDDMEWCRQNISGVEFFHGDEKQDLAVMASCSDHIIANSTFSWWGAWLGHNPSKRIISPSSQRWFGPSNPNFNPKDIIPDRWEQI